MKKLISEPNIDTNDALRLVMLYALRYEKHGSCGTIDLLNILKQRDGSSLHLVPRLIEFAGQHARQSDIFNHVRILDAVKLTRTLLKVCNNQLQFTLYAYHMFHTLSGTQRSGECVHSTSMHAERPNRGYIQRTID